MALTKEQKEQLDVAATAFLEALQPIAPHGSPAITVFSALIMLMHDDRPDALPKAAEFMSAVADNVANRAARVASTWKDRN